MTPHSGTSTNSAHGMASSAVVQPEQLFRAIFEQAAVGVALIETATGRFVRVNQRYCDITGLSRTEMTTTTFMVITHPDDLQADLNNMEELKAGRIREFSMEKRYFRPDGSIVWVDLTVSPMWERGEQPTFHIAVVQDITERKQAQQALRITEGQLTEVLKNSTAIVFMKDPEGHYLLVNQAFEQRFGLNAGQVLGKTDVEIFPVSQAAMFQAHDQEVIQSGMLMEFEEVAQYADGEHTSIVIKFPLRNEESAIYAICGIATDITDRKQAEQSLANLNATLEQQVIHRTREVEESRQQLQAIVDGTSDAVFIKDIKGRYRLFNKAAEGFVGKRQDEVLGNDDRFLFSPVDAQALMEADHKVLTGGMTMTYEDVVTTLDGVVRTFLSTKGPLVDGQGRLTGLFGISRDITERKQAEAALRESEERFRSIFEHAGTGITILDLDGRFLQANPSYCRLVGYTETELRTLDCKQVVHPEDLPGILAQRDRLYAQELPFFEVEGRHRHKDGHDVWVHKFVSMLRDDAGQPRYSFALVTDITERRRAQQILERRVAERTADVREREAKLANLIAHFPGTVSFVDRDLRYRYASPQYEQWFGKKPEDVIGRMIPDIIGREAFERAKPALDRALAGVRVTFENCVVLASGQVQQGLVTFEPEFDADGSCFGFAIFVVDITERKRAEEALRLSEQFKKVVLDSLSASVAVVDRSGVIVAVNRVWEQAAAELDPLGSAAVGVGVNYLEVCRRATGTNPEVQQTLEGLSEVVSGRKDNFETEYVCLTPQGLRWFAMRVTPLGDHQGGAVVVHEDITERKQAEEEVRASYRRLQSVSREVQVATERERSRLSRELHDEFGQLLSALKFDLSRLAAGSGRKSAPSLAVRRKIAVAAMDTVDRLFLSLHEMIRALRPVLLDQLGFIPAIEALAADMRERWGLQCQVQVKCEEFHSSIGVAAEDALYRVAQELLTNVARHANARSVVIMLRCADAWASLTVQDDGDGFKVAAIRRKGRFGLPGIQERVELLGGKVQIRSMPGKGTCVTTRIPIWLDTFDQKTEEMPLSEKP